MSCEEQGKTFQTMNRKNFFKKSKKVNLSWKSLKLCDNYNNSLQVNF